MLSLSLIAGLLFLVVYKYSTRNYNYWKDKGIPYVKPLPFIGSLFELFTFQKQIGVLLASFYRHFKSPYFGIYILDKPMLVIRDPSLIKQICIKDFHNFNDRYVLSNEKCDSIISNMLFFSKNPEWKYIRARTTPIFSIAKLKNMFGLIKEANNDLISYLDKHSMDNYIETKELCAKFSTEVITSCAFGLKANCFSSENAPFRLISRKMFDFNWKNIFNQICYFMAQSIVIVFKMRFFDKEVYSFLRQVFTNAILERKSSTIVRHDIIDAMKKFQKHPYLTENYKLEGDRLLAQAIQFFSAGFETISSTISFALYELSLHPAIQEKLRSEIETTLIKYIDINFYSLQKMNYLTMVVDETLRKYPPASFLDRKCVKSYEVPNQNFVIEEGTPILIALLGLHYDPKHFPNPEVFQPERFLDNSIYNSFKYIPFGNGPRNCIGAPFGLLVVKTCLAYILLKYKVEPVHKTPIPITFSPRSIFLSSTGGIPLKFIKISK